jgi:hypothetical protein
LCKGLNCEAYALCLLILFGTQTTFYKLLCRLNKTNDLSLSTEALAKKAVLRIRDPELGAFLAPGSGIRDGRKSASGSGFRDEQPGSYFFGA